MLRSLDYIGSKVELNYQSHNRFKTSLGGVFTVLVTFLSISCFTYFGLDLIRKQKPITITIEDYIEKPHLKNRDFIFAVGVMGPLASEVKGVERKFNLKMILGDLDSDRGNQTTINTFFDLVPCMDTKVFDQNTNSILNSLLTNKESYFCLPDDFDKNLYGTMNSKNFTVFQFQLNPCSEKDDCVIEEELKREFFPNYWLHFLYLDHYIKLDDYEEPIKSNIKGYLIAGTLGEITTTNLIFDIIQLFSDSGWIFENKHENLAFKLNEVRSNTLTLPDPPYYNVILVSLGDRLRIYKREYLKLQTVLANTGGIVKFLLLLANLINNYFSRFEFTFMLYNNHLSNYTEKESGESQVNAQNQNLANNINVLENVNNINNFNHQNFRNESFKSNTLNFTKNEKKPKLPLINFAEKIIFLCKRNSGVQKKYKEAYNMIKRKLDIVNLIKNYSMQNMQFSQFNQFNRNNLTRTPINTNLNISLKNLNDSEVSQQNNQMNDQSEQMGIVDKVKENNYFDLDVNVKGINSKK